MWQWYIQLPGRSSGTQAIRTRPLAGTLIVSSQDRNSGGAPFTSRIWKKKPWMEGVIHLRLVHHVPYLEFADADGIGAVVRLAVDHPVDAAA
jgi:hypothetical protein